MDSKTVINQNFSMQNLKIDLKMAKTEKSKIPMLPSIRDLEHRGKKITDGYFRKRRNTL